MKSNKANRGRTFEKYMELAGYLAMREKKAMFVRTPPEMKILKGLGGGKFIACFAGYGPPDYLIVDEDCIYMGDAKEFQSRRFGFSHLREHQAEFMSKLEDTNERGVGVLFLSNAGRYWVLPWASIRPKYDAWKAGRKLGVKVKPGGASFSVEFIEENGFEFEVNTLLDALYKAGLESAERRK